MLIRVSSGDFCGHVVADISINSAMYVFNDSSYTHVQSYWRQYYPAVAYFKANFSSDQVTIQYTQLESISATIYDTSQGWTRTLDLFSSNVVTSLGQSSGVVTSASLFPDVYFRMEPWVIFNSQNASLNSTMSITATISIHFTATGGSSRRKRNLEEGYAYKPRHTLRKKKLFVSTHLYMKHEEERIQDSDSSAHPTARPTTSTHMVQIGPWHSWWVEYLASSEFIDHLLFVMMHLGFVASFVIIDYLLKIRQQYYRDVT